jgi:adenylate cyclase
MGGESPRRRERFSEWLKRVDGDPRLLKLVRLARARLPGDARYGDPLSTAGSAAPDLLGRRLSALSAERPSALREAGMSALQVWQELSEVQGRGHGDEELTIVFTDLADYSSWALEAGDTSALHLLRDVGEAIEPELRNRGGRIVKRLGDGLMAVFDDPAQAIEAACAAASALHDVEVDGHRPRLRAGIHVGRPRRLGGDYFGVDVNIAARVTEAAGADQVLISEAVHRRIEHDGINLKRRWRFSGKGAPKGLKVYEAAPE